MITTITKRLAGAVLIAGLTLPATALLPANAPLAIVKANAATLAEFKATLAQYGQFVMHEKYGEVWVPSVTPQGWHPYPACQWVYTKDVGWYFNDDTPWGSIVHHYGRWSNDTRIGWFWVPDEDWSPGWVVWRTSDKWIGWAPMPPRQDVQLVSSTEFNNDKLWTFMELARFGSGGCSTPVPAAQVFYQTDYVSFFDLPPGLLIDIVIVPRWNVRIIKEIIEIIIDRRCPPGRPILRPMSPPTITPIHPIDVPKPIGPPRLPPRVDLPPPVHLPPRIDLPSRPVGHPEVTPQRPFIPLRPIGVGPGGNGPRRPIFHPVEPRRPIMGPRIAINGPRGSKFVR
jgi:hypothetical protein